MRAALRRLAWPLLISLPVLALAVTAARGEVVESGNLVVNFNGGMSPKRLPRHGTAPVSISMAADLSTTDGSRPPQLERLTLEVNRHGVLDARGLPTCRPGQLDLATTREAQRACRGALVGRGHVSSAIALPEQAPFPSEGTLLAFNAQRHGRPVILAHIYGSTPLPISLTVPFQVRRTRGRFGTRLTAAFPQVAADWGYVTHFEMSLGRRWRASGARRSYLSAGCPAPAGVNRALFTLARGTYLFDDGRTLESSVVRSCRVRG
jgi:hypothetical protein